MNTHLHEAAISCQSEVAKLLVDRRANTEAFDKVRKSSLFLIMTLLCYFLSSGHHCKGHIDVVRILLAGKALLDTVDKKVRINSI